MFAFVLMAAELAVAGKGSVHHESFLTVWRRVAETYPDEDFGGVDWAEVRKTYEPRARRARNSQDLRPVLREMLSELGVSHTAVLEPRPEWGFQAEPREEQPGGATRTVWHASVQFGMADGCLAVRAVDAAATDSALLPGDCLTHVAGRAIQDVIDVPAIAVHVPHFALQQDDDGRVAVTVDRDGQTIELEWRGEPWVGPHTQPIGLFPKGPFVASLTRADVDAETSILTMRFQAFDLALMPLLQRVSEAVRTAETTGVIIDLRGNAGGLLRAAQGLAGYVVNEKHTLGTLQQRGLRLELNVFPRPASQRLGVPVALLVDEASASSAEVLAAGLQALAHVRVFGQKTAGAVMGSGLERLPNGDLVQLVVGDLKTPTGGRLEGHGVMPDMTITPTRAQWRAKVDATHEAAIDWLAKWEM